LFYKAERLLRVRLAHAVNLCPCLPPASLKS
jgi:hypothetical protein